MAMGPEARVKHAVKKYLKARGAWFFMPVQNGMGRVGIPDFIVCFEGHFYAIETKAPGKKEDTTANQKRELEGIRCAGGLALVVDDVSQLEKVFTCQRLLQRNPDSALSSKPGSMSSSASASTTPQTS